MPFQLPCMRTTREQLPTTALEAFNVTVTKERANADKAMRPRRREFPGTPAQVRRVRDFVWRTLGESPITADAVLLVSELATNAILHTESGYGLGTFTVTVCSDKTFVGIEVEDAGSSMTPAVLCVGETDEFGGRGLSIVAQLASRWGHYSRNSRHVVWFELSKREERGKHKATRRPADYKSLPNESCIREQASGHIHTEI